MSTPPRRTKTDLRRETPGRSALRGPQPAETSPAEAALLLGDVPPDFVVVGGVEVVKDTGGSAAATNL